MTSSERKIINYLWETKEKTHIRLVAKKANFSSDYARLLCRALARSGHIKFENDLAHLLKKGRSRFENSDLAADEPLAVSANAALLTDKPVLASLASDRSDVVQQSLPQEEKNQEESVSEDKDQDEPTSSNEEPDKALADLKSSSKKEEGEKIDEPEEPEKTESVEGKDAQREAEIPAEPAPKEGAVEKEDAAKPSDNSSLSFTPAPIWQSSIDKTKNTFVKLVWGFKKIVNWFAEKK